MTTPQNDHFYSSVNASNSTQHIPLFDEEIDLFLVYVDACSYGRMGLYSALSPPYFKARVRGVLGVSTLDEALQATRPHAYNGRLERYLVVRLPPLAREALITLLELSEMVERAATWYHKVVILSPFEEAGVQHLVTIMGMAAVRIVEAQLSLSALCDSVLFPPKVGMQEGGRISQVLTTHERRALRQTLQFQAASKQARARNVSLKTIYSQRLTALMKLDVQDIRSFLNLLVSSKKEMPGEGTGRTIVEVLPANRERR